MKALTKEELTLVKTFCKGEKRLFWLCCYRMAKNKECLICME